MSERAEVGREGAGHKPYNDFWNECDHVQSTDALARRVQSTSTATLIAYISTVPVDPLPKSLHRLRYKLALHPPLLPLNNTYLNHVWTWKRWKGAPLGFDASVILNSDR